MKYCKKCLMPDTRPGIKFDNTGICHTCLHFAKQKEIDWKNRCSPTRYPDYLMYLFSVKMSIKLGIKLLIYGEDVNYTYGGEFYNETPSAMKLK